MSRNGRIVENYFFKKRLFFVADGTTRLPRTMLDNPHFRAEIVVSREDLVSMADRLDSVRNGLAEKFAKRLEDPSLTLYLALNRDDAGIAGYFWTAEANDEPIWHDKIYIEPGTALGLNAFTLPEYRGKGAFPLLNAAAIRRTVLEGDARTLYLIVEDSNHASIRANEKLGLKRAGENYLVKVFGENVLSIIHRDRRWETYNTFRNARGKRL